MFGLEIHIRISQLYQYLWKKLTHGVDRVLAVGVLICHLLQITTISEIKLFPKVVIEPAIRCLLTLFRLIH